MKTICELRNLEEHLLDYAECLLEQEGLSDCDKLYCFKVLNYRKPYIPKCGDILTSIIQALAEDGKREYELAYDEAICMCREMHGYDNEKAIQEVTNDFIANKIYSFSIDW